MQLGPEECLMQKFQEIFVETDHEKKAQMVNNIESRINVFLGFIVRG